MPRVTSKPASSTYPDMNFASYVDEPKRVRATKNEAANSLELKPELVRATGARGDLWAGPEHGRTLQSF